MGKMIDRLVGLLFAAAALYLLFMHAFGSIPAACVFSLIGCAGLICLLSHRSRNTRMTDAQATAILHEWVYAPDDEARIHVARLLCVTSDSQALIYLGRHPEASVSIGDVFSAWKGHQGEEKILIAATCRADAKARTFAGTLKKPSVEIVDAPRLIAKIRRSELAPPRIPHGRALYEKLRLAVLALPRKRGWKQNAMFGILLFGLYWLTGNAAYLFLGLASLFLAGVGLRNRNA